MPQQRGTLQIVGATLMRVLRPLHERFVAGELRQIPPGIDTDAGVRLATRAVADVIQNLDPILESVD
jgi:hypothetical protein